jgi:hypothetical protein
LEQSILIFLSNHHFEKMYTKFYPGILKRRDHLRNIDIDGSIILTYVLKKYDLRIYRLDSAGSE